MSRPKAVSRADRGLSPPAGLEAWLQAVQTREAAQWM
jgi:hypothetical protein